MKAAEERGATYWDEVIVSRGASRPQTLWRAHADRINTDLCRAWWPASRPARVLKTDLFDEASGAGLWPAMHDGAGVAYGIDHSIGTVRMARARYTSAPVTAADVRRLPFRDEAFDVIVSDSTLDHFERREEIGASLRECWRVLAPGGRLILTLDNPINPLIALRNALPFQLLNGLGVVPYYVGATLGPARGRELLTSIGFRVLDVAAIMHCPRAIAVAAGWVLDRTAGSGVERAFVGSLHAFEALARFPSRFLTGYYVAFLAEKGGLEPSTSLGPASHEPRVESPYEMDTRRTQPEHRGSPRHADGRRHAARHRRDRRRAPH